MTQQDSLKASAEFWSNLNVSELVNSVTFCLSRDSKLKSSMKGKTQTYLTDPNINNTDKDSLCTKDQDDDANRNWTTEIIIEYHPEGQVFENTKPAVKKRIERVLMAGRISGKNSTRHSRRGSIRENTGKGIAYQESQDGDYNPQEESKSPRKTDQKLASRKHGNSIMGTKDKSEIVRRNFWTPEEDEIVKALVKKHGKEWSLLSKFMGGTRTGKQIRDRYVSKLAPTITSREWTKQEDEMLVQYWKELGNKWALIASRLEGRTEVMVKNRYNTVIVKCLGPDGQLNYNNIRSQKVISEEPSNQTFCEPTKLVPATGRHDNVRMEEEVKDSAYDSFYHGQDQLTLPPLSIALSYLSFSFSNQKDNKTSLSIFNPELDPSINPLPSFQRVQSALEYFNEKPVQSETIFQRQHSDNSHNSSHNRIPLLPDAGDLSYLENCYLRFERPSNSPMFSNKSGATRSARSSSRSLKLELLGGIKFSNSSAYSQSKSAYSPSRSAFYNGMHLTSSKTKKLTTEHTQPSIQQHQDNEMREESNYQPQQNDDSFRQNLAQKSIIEEEENQPNDLVCFFDSEDSTVRIDIIVREKLHRMQSLWNTAYDNINNTDNV